MLSSRYKSRCSDILSFRNTNSRTRPLLRQPSSAIIGDVYHKGTILYVFHTPKKIIKRWGPYIAIYDTFRSRFVDM